MIIYQQLITALITLVLWLGAVISMTAQSPLLDSLRGVTQQSNVADSTLSKAYADMAWEYKVSNPTLALALLDSSQYFAERTYFPQGIGNIFNYRGVIYSIQGDYVKAEENYAGAIPIRDSLGDIKGVASLYNNIGNLQKRQGNFISALSSYTQSKIKLEEVNDTVRLANVAYNMANLHEQMGNYPEALDLLYQFLFLAENLRDSTKIAQANVVLGNIKYETARLNDAKSHYNLALQIFEDQQSPDQKAQVYINLGNVSLKEEKLDSAKGWYNEALDIFKELEIPKGQANAYNNLGKVYSTEGDYKEAIIQLNRADSIYTVINDKQGLSEVNLLKSDNYRHQKKWSAALKSANKGYLAAQEIGDEKLKIIALEELALGNHGIGHDDRAFQQLRQAQDLKGQRYNDKQIKDFERREVLYGDAKKQLEIERQKRDIELKQVELQRARLRQRALLFGAAGLLLISFLLYNRYQIKSQANKNLAEKNKIIENERQRSENLLLNILPKSTAEELKANGKAAAKGYEYVTVLFTDFKGFTKIASEIPANEVVSALDDCFQAFDTITAKYGIEKIKTIGDAYMCASGLPEPRADHATIMCQAAEEMIKFINERNKTPNLRTFFEVRIGMHSGPVIAGVVGSRKFAYDIWGDTVNIAARMESASEPGRINISESTNQLVKQEFVTIPRGSIEVKNRGSLEMYFLDYTP